MISVIIPAYNEESSIRRTIAYVFAHAAYKRLLTEVIVVDGGSTDGTVAEVRKTDARIMISPRRGRTIQLNYGAKKARGKILYFLQSHSLPPENFISEIVKASSKGYAGGTFALKFDCRHWLLNALSWITNNGPGIYLSDQSLFVTKELFDKTGGFRQDQFVMANQEIISRLKRYTNFIVIKDNIISSAGKYLRYGIIKTQFIQALAFAMHRMGYSQYTMIKLYRKHLHWDIGPKEREKEKGKEKILSNLPSGNKVPILSK